MGASKKSWIVIATGERPLNEISEDLRQKGFTVNSVLEAIGQITGESSVDVSKESLHVKGVADVVPMAGNIQLPSPGEDLTW